MQSLLAFAAVALFAGSIAWFWVAIRKYAARKHAEAAREAAFLAQLAGERAARAAAAAQAQVPPAAAAVASQAADPVESAAAKIRLALTQGRGAEAVSVFTANLEHRARLALAPAEWDALGRVLLGQGAFLEAAWTLHAGALLAGDTVAAQKRLVEIAAKAAAAGQPQAALKLYASVLEKYPASEYAPFVRSSMKVEERKLKA